MQESCRQSRCKGSEQFIGFFKYGHVVLFALGRVLGILMPLAIVGIEICDASILNQTNFEDEEMTSWEFFVTSNGTVGGEGFPAMALFEVAKDGLESTSLKFKVGQVRYEPDNHPEQGGGLVLQVRTEVGVLELSAQLAVTYSSPKDKRNLAGGLFEWLVDDQVIGSHDIGPIENGRILRHLFKASHQVNEGNHSIRLRITRPFTSHPGQQAPFQFVDDLFIQLSPNP